MEKVFCNPYSSNLKKKLVIAIVSLFFIGKIFLIFFLPDKYLYDGTQILNSLTYGIKLDDSFMFSVALNKPIYDIFQFSSIEQWSVFYGFLGSIILYVFIRNWISNKYNKYEYAYFFSSIFLLNIYVFNLSKDIIIFLFVGIISYIIQKNKINSNIKFVLISFILLLISLCFKKYYLLILCFFWFFYFIYHFINGKNYFLYFWKGITLCLILVFLFLLGIKLFLPSIYNELVTVRTSVNLSRIGSEDAQTIILSIFSENQNLIFDFLNIFISLILLLFPINLVFTFNPLYIAFFLYQILSEFIVIKYCKRFFNTSIGYKNIRKYANSFYFSLLLAFWVVSSTFEPDFGSFLRHEISFVFLPICALSFETERMDRFNDIILIQSLRI